MKFDKNTVFQIAIILMLLLIGYYLLSSNNAARVLKEHLNEVKLNLNQAQDSLQSARINLEGLQKDLNVFKDSASYFGAQRDSILLAFRRKTAENWEDLQEIKEQQQIINDRLNYLRQKSKKYQ